ncbi:uncharacterized protein BDR25DRAFT_352171 [Lindgomyces ingoldianus]|uniref:Uncharacterized protein n=1 Tax=Lindgomyces ingoldianus TaxID=673940 RepID=A0ACB6R3G9_9PLEO|nr:uncharacterized protein BDR25DRAFT_352171 [Lindgomyces ingoldianus]KAF2473681.1 hypothetical protein BDR25DRAFT_352171 [Lindgomyces ingoldianus]
MSCRLGIAWATHPRALWVTDTFHINASYTVPKILSFSFQKSLHSSFDLPHTCCFKVLESTCLPLAYWLLPIPLKLWNSRSNYNRLYRKCDSEKAQLLRRYWYCGGSLVPCCERWAELAMHLRAKMPLARQSLESYVQAGKWCPVALPAFPSRNGDRTTWVLKVCSISIPLRVLNTLNVFAIEAVLSYKEIQFAASILAIRLV